MDALSRLIELAHVRGSLDVRCRLAGRFAMDHEPMTAGIALFHLVLSGRTVIERPLAKPLELSAGDFLLLPRGSAHLVRDVDATSIAGPVTMDLSGPLPLRQNTDAVVDLDLLCGRFTYTSGKSDLVMATLPDAVHVSLADTDHLDALRGVVALLRSEVMQVEAGAIAIVTALSQALFVLAIRGYAQRDNIPASLLGLLTDARLSRAVIAMLRQPEQKWTVGSLAEKALMSRATFTRQFVAKGGVSPLALLTTLRVQSACDLLSREDLVTADVAGRVGYQSESAFSKVFSQRIGVTPAVFRRQYKSNVS